jgi:hypothetical protein
MEKACIEGCWMTSIENNLRGENPGGHCVSAVHSVGIIKNRRTIHISTGAKHMESQQCQNGFNN